MLQKRDFDIQANIGLFPEARPEAYANKKRTTLGSSFQIQYGFSDKFNMALKAWSDIESREYQTRAGGELSAQIIRPIDSKSHLIFIPHIDFTASSWNGAYGVGTSAIFHTQVSDRFAYYEALGITWGAAIEEKRSNELGELRQPGGFAIHGNAGISWELLQNFRLNIEVNPIYQINIFDKNQQFILAPQIGLGYTFRKEKEEDQPTIQ